jgi:tetratricopeptide (TPR) repeat protein
MTLDRHAEALPLCERALEASERVLGAEHPDTLACVKSLARCLRALGRDAEALPFCERALEASERVLGAEHSDTLALATRLAVSLVTVGRAAEALPLCQRTLEACERAVGAEHPNTLACVKNLAGCLGALDRAAEALPLCRRALEVGERVLGAEQPDTLVLVSNLAGCLMTLDRAAEALPLYQRAMEVGERVLGAEHPDTLALLDNLAGCFGALGRELEALPLYVRSSQRTLGPEHPDTLAYGRELARRVDISVGNLSNVLKTLPVLSKVRLLDAAEADALVATLGGVAADLAALPRGEAAGRLCRPVLRHLWPLLKALLLDPARRPQVVARHGLYLLTFLLGALLEPPHRWYCRCSCALDAAQVLLAVRADAGAALPDAQRASDALEQLAGRLACEDLDAPVVVGAPPAAAASIAETQALWGMLLRCEELARAAAAEAMRPLLPPDDARALTALCVGVATRFKARIKAVEPSLGARAQNALHALLLSFVLSSLKARLCRADLFPRLEGLQLFRDELGLQQLFRDELKELFRDEQDPLLSLEEQGLRQLLRDKLTGRALSVVRAAGRERLGLWLCDWSGCTNMQGPSELQLVAMPCPGRCKHSEPAAKCGRRFCSAACRAAAACHTKKPPPHHQLYIGAFTGGRS